MFKFAVLECFQWILFDLPPTLAIWELRIGLPSDDALWECADSEAWEHQFQTQDGIESFPFILILDV